MITNQDKYNILSDSFQLENDIANAVSALIADFTEKHNVPVSGVDINFVSTRPYGQMWEEYAVSGSSVTLAVLDK